MAASRGLPPDRRSSSETESARKLLVTPLMDAQAPGLSARRRSTVSPYRSNWLSVATVTQSTGMVDYVIVAVPEGGVICQFAGTADRMECVSDSIGRRTTQRCPVGRERALADQFPVPRLPRCGGRLRQAPAGSVRRRRGREMSKCWAAVVAQRLRGREG